MVTIKIENSVFELFPDLIKEELIKGNEVRITKDGEDYIFFPALVKSEPEERK